ncbi:MAG: preprotein translocase subunit YajC [Phycisphaerales bacterium]
MLDQVTGLSSAWLALAQDAPTGGANAVGMPGATAQPAGPATTTPGAAPGTGAPTGGGTSTPSSPFGGIFLPMIVVLGVIILMQVFGGRKQKKQREQLMANLKKNDQVFTTAGIIGTIVKINENDVVLRVEDGQIRFSKSAIQGVMSSSPGAKADTTAELKPENSHANA